MASERLYTGAMRLGVFDSGIGGEAIAAALRLHFPLADICTVSDTNNLPYGEKSLNELRRLTDAAIQPIIGSDVIVIACNSATTAAIDWLRQRYPQQQFIGIEPMLKPAAELTKTKVVAVCATPATLASPRYKQLRQTYTSDITVLEPDCSAWAQMIEDNAMSTETLQIQIEALLANNADVIVLGCTHYHWIKDGIVQLAGGQAVVLEPSDAIAARVSAMVGRSSRF